IAAADLAGLAGRGATRALADVSADGTVQALAWNRASTIDLSAVAPRAWAAYTEAAKPLFAIAKRKRPDPRAMNAAKTRALEEATACATAERRMQETKQSIVGCAFALEACDGGKVEALTKQIDDARYNA